MHTHPNDPDNIEPQVKCPDCGERDVYVSEHECQWDEDAYGLTADEADDLADDLYGVIPARSEEDEEYRLQVML